MNLARFFHIKPTIPATTPPITHSIFPSIFSITAADVRPPVLAPARLDDDLPPPLEEPDEEPWPLDEPDEELPEPPEDELPDEPEEPEEPDEPPDEPPLEPPPPPRRLNISGLAMARLVRGLGSGIVRAEMRERAVRRREMRVLRCIVRYLEGCGGVMVWDEVDDCMGSVFCVLVCGYP